MSARSLLTRVAAMEREELRFRTLCEARKLAGRVRFAVARPRWHRRDLVRILDGTSGTLVQDAREAMAHRDELGAHRALARHFAQRPPHWPIAARRREELTRGIQERFPMAAAEAADRAEAIAEGRYELLGFHDLALGSMPNWHADAVHGRRARRGYWAAVPFLDPASGDHKIIWELNRHQHFLALGTAWWLTDREHYRDTFIAQLEDWIDANPPLDGINWASMLELAFRALSWTWAVEFFSAHADGDRTPWLVDLLVALDRQLTHVEHNLSTYFSPNTHISGEALALYAVSRAFPELRQSESRAAVGRQILLREAAAQIRADGGHAELSSHYHRYSTDFYLLALQVARLTDDPAAASFEAALRAQASFLRTIADARGRLANIGDDDGGQLFRFEGPASAEASSSLAAAAELLDDRALLVSAPGRDVWWVLGRAPRLTRPAAGGAPWPSRLLPDSGYFVSRHDARGDHLIFDAGAHGFLNGGHAHADALSVVLTVGGEPVLVDPGTGTYTMDAAVRDGLRAPAMHNTLTLDGRPFAVSRGPFHWERVTDARMLVARTGPDMDFAVGGHEAYGCPVMRAVITLGTHGWLVVDYVNVARAARVEAFWHLHPSWSATPVEAGFALRHTGGRQLALATTASDCTMEMQRYSREYGRLEHAPALRTAMMTSGGAAVMAAFVPAATAAGVVPSVTQVARDTSARPGWTTYTFSIAAQAELLVSVDFTETLAAQAGDAVWPQPCIQETRLVCVE